MRCFKRIVIAAVLLSGIAVSLLWQNFSLQTEAVSITVPDLPSEFDGLRIVHLSDLHGREFGEDNARLLEAVAAAAPDLICISGDLFDESTELNVLPPLLEGLVAIAPTYYATGNHEFQVDAREAVFSQMEQLGVTVLRDEYAILERGTAKLILAGVDDPCGPLERKSADTLVEEIRQAHGEDVCIIMLAHRNDTLPLWEKLGVQLVLTGHCHGGVVRLPILGGIFGTHRELLPAYDAGLYQSGDTSLFVSRGLGYSRVKFRLFNRPHLPILTLECEKS